MKKKKRIKLQRPEASCLTCSNCIPIGEGDHICHECGAEPTMVISDYAPTDEYMMCRGWHYET